jgi:drug/metabolite transporter (DMT)-like permease
MSAALNLRLLGLTGLALIAFAANSLLARAGLISPDMGAKEFTLIRLISGAVMLAVLLRFTPASKRSTRSGSWWGAAMLLLYALMFSLAYVTLDTGLGALCLFTAVQLTILGAAAFKKTLSTREALGAFIAFGGFIYLILPTLNGAGGMGIFMMALSGIGWGVYTLLGRGAKAPLALTGYNFTRASLLSLPLLLLIFPSPIVSIEGIGLAVISGALTSGCGYAVWYAVLPQLRRSIAGVSQLLVPPLAALMGWIVLGEALTLRLLIATLIILSGLMIVTLKPQPAQS